MKWYNLLLINNNMEQDSVISILVNNMEVMMKNQLYVTRNLELKLMQRDVSTQHSVMGNI